MTTKEKKDPVPNVCQSLREEISKVIHICADDSRRQTLPTGIKNHP